MWSKLTVDMATATMTRAPLDEAFRELGGRALIAQYMMANVPPTCDPLGEQNVLMLCGGVFAGTNFTTANRMSVGGKSPLTGGIKESNVGGYFGPLLAEHGLRLVTVHGLPQDGKLYLLYIKANGEVELLDAEAYRGMGTYECSETMHEIYGDAVAVMSIGPAGERGYKAASIHVTEFGTGHPCRAAARGGLGALMGSKGLKAVVIEKPTEKFKIPYADDKSYVML